MVKKKTARRKSRPNKSKLIRDFMDANPEAGPKAVAHALTKPGFKVSPAFVSTIKSTDKRKTGAGYSRDAISMTALLQAKELVKQMGGVERARTALDAFARLVD